MGMGLTEDELLSAIDDLYVQGGQPTEVVMSVETLRGICTQLGLATEDVDRHAKTLAEQGYVVFDNAAGKLTVMLPDVAAPSLFEDDTIDD